MKRFAVPAVLALAACSQHSTPDKPRDSGPTTPPASATAAAKPAPTAEATPVAPNAAAPADAAALPPADGAQPRYVGSWATAKELCASGAWRFGATRLETAGDISCDYAEVEKVPGGYDLHATCTAEGPPRRDLIKLRFAESAQAMLVDSKILSPTGLIYCGPLE